MLTNSLKSIQDDILKLANTNIHLNNNTNAADIHMTQSSTRFNPLPQTCYNRRDSFGPSFKFFYN
jgi:hypothetical protein